MVIPSFAEQAPIEDCFDRANIDRLHDRFSAINEERLERVRGALSDRQQIFMDALPLLLHLVDANLPGFTREGVPGGLSHFRPTRHDVLVGKSLSPSFSLDVDREPPETQILAIYLMGSVGSIAHSGRSDLDIWVCHRTHLDGEARAALQEKCEVLSEWAATLRLEVHFFLMDQNAFAAGHLHAMDQDSSGSAQRLLLLDEFYRSAVYVAGQKPLWWYIPAGEEQNYREYANTLLYRQLLPETGAFDFGPVAAIPAAEYLGAGIWHLYKAIESPYKSLLKLLLLEAYAADYPDGVPLALQFKAAVWEGDLQIDAVDSYLLMYRRIEHYLYEIGDNARLALARRGFYIKANRALSRLSHDKPLSVPARTLKNLVEEWEWDNDTLRSLDDRNHWKAETVSFEHRQLVAALNTSYRFLLRFAEEHAKARTISSRDLATLGRKLQSAFATGNGKIDWINRGIRADISEARIAIAQSCDTKDGHMRHTAIAGTEGQKKRAIVTSESLVELILWCHCNNVVTAQTQFESSESIDRDEILRLISIVKRAIPLPLPNQPQANFERSAEPESVLLLVNVDPDPRHRKRAVQAQMSRHADPLNFGSGGDNLVGSVDIVVSNSWNEITARRFTGRNALLDAVMDYLSLTLPGTHQTPPAIQVHCVQAESASAIEQRLSQFFSDVRRCFFNSAYGSNKRYVFQLSGVAYCLMFRGLKPHYERFERSAHLLSFLQQDAARVSPIVLDRRAFTGHPIHAVFKSARPGGIDVFYKKNDQGLDIYVVDERGALWHHNIQGAQWSPYLKSLSRFLHNVINERKEETGSNKLGVEILELFRDTHERWQAEPRDFKDDTPDGPTIDVSAISIPSDPRQGLRFDFRCNERSFRCEEYGERIDYIVADEILRLREKRESYPLYISHLSLPGKSGAVQFMRIKLALEARINHAIGVLLSA